MSISARNGQNLATKWPERCSNPAGTGPVCHLRRKTASIGRKMGEKGRDPGGGRGRRGRLVSFPQKLPPFCHKWPQTAIQNTGGWAGMSIVLENGRWPRNVSETEIHHRAGYPRMRSSLVPPAQPLVLPRAGPLAPGPNRLRPGPPRRSGGHSNPLGPGRSVY
jgi:hypothetical protein